MKKINTITVLGMLLSGFLFNSCEKSEKIDDFPMVKPGLVINSLFTADDSLVLDISRSLSVLDNAQLKRVTQAKVVLYIDGLASDSVMASSADEFYHLPVIPQVGKSYQVKVSHASYPTVTSSVERLPAKVDILKTQVMKTDSNFWWYYDGQDTIYGGYFRAKANLRFRDPASSGNYYILRILAVDTAEDVDEEFSTHYISTLNSSDLSLDEASIGITSNSSSMLFFNDQVFNGQEYTFYCDFTEWDFRASKLYFFELSSLSESAYLYLRTREAYNRSIDDPFAEPVQVFNNISGGFGIFAGVSKSYYMFKL